METLQPEAPPENGPDSSLLFDFDALEVSAAKVSEPLFFDFDALEVSVAEVPETSFLFDVDALEVSVAEAPVAPPAQAAAPAAASGAGGPGHGAGRLPQLAQLAPKPAPARSGAYQWPVARRRPEPAAQPGEPKPLAGGAAAAAPGERRPLAWNPPQPGAARAEAAPVAAQGPGRPEAAPAAPGALRAESALVENGLGGQRVLLLLLLRSAGTGTDAEKHRGDEEQPCSIVDAVRRLLGISPRWPPPFTEPRPAHFGYNDPQHPTIYGGWFGQLRAPTVLLEAPSQEIARYLREDPEGPFVRVMDEKEWTRWGFVRDRAQNSVLKADWHTLLQVGEEAEVWVPRLPAVRVVKRAPPRLMAFISVFRSINQACWYAMMETLAGVRRARMRQSLSSSRVRQFDSIASSIQNQRHFGILEVQVRWGSHGMRGPSHKDGATSLLHLGLTLGGHRVLRIGAFPSGNSAGNRQHIWRSDDTITGDMDAKERDVMLGEADVWEEDIWPPGYLKDVEMAPGSAYLSSPFCVEHGVEYYKCSEEDPVIAVQCRFGFSGALGKELNDDRSEDMREVASIVAESFRASCVAGLLRMPTVGEVQREEARFRGGGV